MKTVRFALPLALLLALTGCVGSLLGGGKPVQLYRLGRVSPDAPIATPAPVTRTVVMLDPIRFAPGIDGDRLLAVRGVQLFYLKDTRWVANAPDLFGQALRSRFARRTPELLLTTDRAAAAATLQVSVTRFEAVYDEGAGKDAPPKVRIEAEARLLGRDRTVLAEQRFAAEVPAGDNRVGPIVEAFGVASDEVLDEVADWARTSLASGSGALKAP